MTQLLLSITLLGLTITRVHYTMNLPRGDPLNGGRNFYGTPLFLCKGCYS